MKIQKEVESRKAVHPHLAIGSMRWLHATSVKLRMVKIYEFHSLGRLWVIIVEYAHTGADMAPIQMGPTSTIEQLCLASPQFHMTTRGTT